VKLAAGLPLPSALLPGPPIPDSNYPGGSPQATGDFIARLPDPVSTRLAPLTRKVQLPEGR
jgi:hypothetical protein